MAEPYNPSTLTVEERAARLRAEHPQLSETEARAMAERQQRALTYRGRDMRSRAELLPRG